MLRVTVLLLVFIALQDYVEGVPLQKDDRSVNIQTRRSPRTVDLQSKDWSHFYPSWWVPSFSSFSMGSSFKDEDDYDYDMAFLKRRIVALEKSHRELVQSFKQLAEETKKASCNAALVQEVSDQQAEKRPQNVENEKEKPLDSNTGNIPLVPAVSDEVVPKSPQNEENEMKKPLDNSIQEIPLVPAVSDEVTQKRPQNEEKEMKKPLDSNTGNAPLVPAVSDEVIPKRPQTEENEMKKPLDDSTKEIPLVPVINDEVTQKRPQNEETEMKKPLDGSTKEIPLVPVINDEVIPKRPQNEEIEMKKPLDDSIKEIPLAPVINDEVLPKRPQNEEIEMKKPLDDSIKEIPTIPAVSDEVIPKRPQNEENEKNKPLDGNVKPLDSNIGEVEKGNTAENTRKEQPQSVPEATNGDSAGVVATNVDKGTTLPSKVNEMVTPTQNDDTEAVALVNGDEVDETTLEDGEKAGSTPKPERVEAAVAMEELTEPRVDRVMELNAELESPEIVADAESDIVLDQLEEAIGTIGGAASTVEFAGTLDDGVSVAEN